MADSLRHHLMVCKPCEDSFLEGWGTAVDNEKELSEVRSILTAQAILQSDPGCHLDGRCNQIPFLKERHVDKIEATFNSINIPTNNKGLLYKIDKDPPAKKNPAKKYTAHEYLAEDVAAWRKVYVEVAERYTDINDDYACKYLKAGSLYGRCMKIKNLFHNDKRHKICSAK